jgi:hypothetical protein
MPKVEKILELSPQTLQALEELAKITGAERGVGEVIQDALKVFEWVIFHQMRHFLITPLTEEEFKKLDLPPNREILTNLIENGKGAEEQAKKYFSATSH